MRVCSGCRPRLAARRPAIDDAARTGRPGCLLHAGALSSEAVANIVQDAVSAAADVSLLTLAAKTRGNPFLLTELIRGLNEANSG